MEYKAKDTVLGALKRDAQELLKKEAQAEKPKQLKLYAKFINHQLAAWAALFELITGTRPPKVKEILAVISGH